MEVELLPIFVQSTNPSLDIFVRYVHTNTKKNIVHDLLQKFTKIVLTVTTNVEKRNINLNHISI